MAHASHPAPPTGVAAEHLIDVELVRRLLRAQHADLAAHELRLVAEGWDSVVVHTGQHLADLL